MKLVRRMGTVGRVLTTVIASVSFFMLVFVVYGHVLSVRDAQVALASPRETHFTSAAALEQEYSASLTGGLTYEVTGDALAIHGTATSPGAQARFSGASARLVESRLKIHFRAISKGNYDVDIGLETTGSTTYRLTLELSRFHERCFARLVGDASVGGALSKGDAVLAETPVAACDSEWHDLTLLFAPNLITAIASLDDTVLFTPFIQWDAMTMVRPTLAVRVTEASAPLDIRISEITWKPTLVDPWPTDIDDTFGGKIIDPLWRVTRGDADTVDAHISSGSRGLVIIAQGLSEASNINAYDLNAPSSPLTSFHATAEIDVTTLNHATFHFEIQNEPGPPWRFAQVGFLSLGDGVLVPFGSGHFDENGRPRFLATPEAAHGIGRVTLTFDYDARLRRAHATFCGRPFFDDHIDLPPLAVAHFSMGANVDGKGMIDLAVRSLHIDHSD